MGGLATPRSALSARRGNRNRVRVVAAMKEHPYVHLPATLESVPFLSGLDERTLEQVLRASSLLEFEKGESVVVEGSDAKGFYVLLRGAVDVVKDGAKVAELSGRGETIGEQNLLRGGPRGASVVATNKVFCLRVDRGELDELDGEQKIAYEAALYRFLAEILIARLESTNERLAAAEAELRTARGG